MQQEKNTPPNLSRVEAAQFLTDHGFPISHRTLAKYACLGGGPNYRKFGTRALYSPDGLLAWAEAKTSDPVMSTSAGIKNKRQVAS